ncbi:hypothetical protein ACFFRR_010364 [Megaselia abdita]
MIKIVLYLSLLGFSRVFCQSDIDEICEERSWEGLNYLRYPSDCSSYIGCDESAYLGSCGDDYYFNEEIQNCDEKENVQCDSDPEPEPEITIATTTTSTEPPTTTTTTETSTTSSAASTAVEEEETTDSVDGLETTESITNDFRTSSPTAEGSTTKIVELQECPQGNEKVTFLASKKSCEDFYFCFNGVPLPMQCADDLYFNPAKGKCDFKGNVKCTVGRPYCDRTMHKFFPHEKSCNMFYYCRFGHLTIQRCPYFFNWNDEKHECQLNYGEQCS